MTVRLRGISLSIVVILVVLVLLLLDVLRVWQLIVLLPFHPAITERCQVSQSTPD